MTRVLILCEGQTEETFANLLLGPHLTERGIFVECTRIATSQTEGRRTHRGGHAHRFDLIKKDIQRLLGSKPAAVSTMLDVYGFPTNMPGYPDPWPVTTKARVDALCAALSANIGDRRFIPGVIAHEFEGLLFSDPRSIADVAVQEEEARAAACAELMAIARAYTSPEDIDDGRETAPSKRLLRVIPRYAKPRHGPLIAERIGLGLLRERCPLFSAWVGKLEALGQPPAATG
jgi:hypothetical protein